eukprot:gene32586-42204_t
MASSFESDEAFARRLQDQEMGTHAAADPQTPLMAAYNRTPALPGRQVNPGAVNARFNELTGTRTTLLAIISMNVPQIFACLVVLSTHWTDPDVCDPGHTRRWKLWALVSALRMLAYIGVNSFMHMFRPLLQERQEYLAKAVNIRNTIDAIGLVWFVVGNMWLFGDEGSMCKHPQQSPIYNLCIALLVINYIQICLPCIIAILLIPVFCFCMPCLIRILARLQDPRLQASCPICLSTFVVGEVARSLRCKHIFHKECLDEWLRVNASCPTCRKRILDDTPLSSTSISTLGRPHSEIAMTSLITNNSNNNNTNNTTSETNSSANLTAFSGSGINSTAGSAGESSSRAVGNLVLHV